MEINTYNTDTSSEELANLLQEKYGNNNDFDYFLNDFKKSLNFCTDNENITFYPVAGFEDGKMSAHAALIVDKRLPIGEAFFGFLEFPDDASVFSALWSSLIKEARNKGISTLKGPVNGSIWHQYRCIKETNHCPFFKAEPFCESYYYDFLTSNKPAKEILYCSASREPFDIVLQIIGERVYDNIINLGFSIKETKSITPDELRTIAHISKIVFHDSWGYTELDEQEFLQLYSSEKLMAHLNTLYLLYKGNEMIGFCSTSKEDDHTLICKTIAVLPPYQGLGLGNALAYKFHVNAHKEGFKKIIYALIREDNNVKNFPKDDTVIFRRYAAFEFQL